MRLKALKSSVLKITLAIFPLLLVACSSSSDSSANVEAENIVVVDSTAEDTASDNTLESPSTDLTVTDEDTLTDTDPSNSLDNADSIPVSQPAPDSEDLSVAEEPEIELPTLPVPAQAGIQLVSDKTFRITWPLSDGADFYRVLENPDGVSGFVSVSDDISANTDTSNSDSSTETFDHRVALYKRVNARYIVESCNDEGCVNSNELLVSGSLAGAIGYFKASNTDGASNLDNEEFGDTFGASIVISADGNTLAIGARGEDSLATGIDGDQGDNSAVVPGRDTGAGAVYVFALGSEGWQQQAYLKASNTRRNNSFDVTGANSTPEIEFGGAISINANGNTLVVGAQFESSAATGINGNEADTSARNAGAVYVFERVNQVWQQQAYVKASNAAFGDFFGRSVSVSADGNTFAVSAIFEDSSSTGVNGNQNDDTAQSSGAVYVFTRANGLWQQQAYIKASNTNRSDLFGSDVSMSADGTVLAVGASGEASSTTGVNGNQSDNTFPRSGAVYIFVLANGVWQQQAYLKASNTDQIDQFGSSLSLSGDGNTLAVGTPGESSGLMGINNENQRDLSAEVSGAVFVFQQTNGLWQQQAYIKASNTDAFDTFGVSVSLSTNGNTLAVGASSEDSAAIGINGDEAENSAGNSGAVYVFNRISDTWQQQAYLKASNNRPSDADQFFGAAVSLSGDGNSLAVGAQGESSASTGVNGDQNSATAFGAGAVYLY